EGKEAIRRAHVQHAQARTIRREAEPVQDGALARRIVAARRVDARREFDAVIPRTKCGDLLVNRHRVAHTTTAPNASASPISKSTNLSRRIGPTSPVSVAVARI